MGFFTKIFGGGPSKHEDQGDERRLDLLYPEAAFFYQKALEGLDESAVDDRTRVKHKLREVRRKAFSDLIEDADDLVQEGDRTLAKERLETARSFAASEEDQNLVSSKLEALRATPGSLEETPSEIPDEVSGTDDDLFDLLLEGMEHKDRDTAKALGAPFQSAYEACQNEQWDEAAAQLESLSAQSPDSAMIWEMKGMALEHQGNTEAALSALEKALGLEPSRATSIQGLASVLRSLDRGAKASRILKEAVDGHPANGSLSETWVEIHLDYAMSLAETGHFESGLQILKGLLSEPLAKPGFLYFNMAGILEEAGREAEARAVLEKAVEVSPRTSMFRERLADFLLNRGVDLDLALRLLVEANEVETTSAGGMFGGGPGKATISPNRGRYLYKMARIYFLKGEDLEANRTITTALAVTKDRDVVTALENLREELKQPRA